MDLFAQRKLKYFFYIEEILNMGSCSSSTIKDMPYTQSSQPGPLENAIGEVTDTAAIEEAKQQVMRPDGSIDPRFIIDFGLIMAWPKVYEIECTVMNILKDLDKLPPHHHTNAIPNYKRCMSNLQQCRTMASFLLRDILLKGEEPPAYLNPKPLDFSPWKQYLTEN